MYKVFDSVALEKVPLCVGIVLWLKKVSSVCIINILHLRLLNMVLDVLLSSNLYKAKLIPLAGTLLYFFESKQVFVIDMQLYHSSG